MGRMIINKKNVEKGKEKFSKFEGEHFYRALRSNKKL